MWGRCTRAARARERCRTTSARSCSRRAGREGVGAAGEVLEPGLLVVAQVLAGDVAQAPAGLPCDGEVSPADNRRQRAGGAHAAEVAQRIGGGDADVAVLVGAG